MIHRENKFINPIVVRSEFYKGIGAFIFEFNRIEFSLAYYICMIETGKNSLNFSTASKYLKLSLSDKIKYLKQQASRLNINVPLREDLLSMLDEVKELDFHRRFICHGLGIDVQHDDKFLAMINVKGIVKHNTYTIMDINKLINRASNVNRGDNGLAGELHEKIRKSIESNWTEDWRHLDSFNKKSPGTSEA